MFASLTHRTHDYHNLQNARSHLMTLRLTRTGLFVEKKSDSLACPSVLRLLAEIAAAKLEELRLLLRLDAFEKHLQARAQEKTRKRLWLGLQKEQEASCHHHVPSKKPRNTLVTYLAVRAWLRGQKGPAPR